MDSLEKYKEISLFNGCTFKLKVFEVVHNQYSVLRLHWHDYLEFIYFAEGQAILSIGSATHEVSAGDILFVNSRQLHSGYSLSNTLVKYYAIVFDQSLFLSDMEDPNYRKYIMPFMEGTRSFPVRIEKTHPCYSRFVGNIGAIIEEYNDELPGFEVKIKSCIYSLFIDLIREYLPISPSNTESKAHLQEIKSIRNLISHIYLSCPIKMTINEAAKYVKLSPYYFCKIFKKTTGWTFIEFLNIYKINKAEELLIYTNESITCIASDLGFCNTNYFNKVFKQLKGISPSVFRKKMGIKYTKYDHNHMDSI